MAQSWIRESHKSKGKPRSERRWEVVYNDPLTGRRRTKGGFGRKRDAEEWQTGYEHSRRAGSYIDPASGLQTWSAAAQAWLAAQHDLKPRTRASYSALINSSRSRVRRALVDCDGLVYDTPKTPRSRRTVALDAYLTEELASYLAAHRRAALAWCTSAAAPFPGEALPLFVGSATGRSFGRVRLDYSKPLRHSAWYGTHWHAALRRVGLPESVRFHDLRHTYASWLVAAGVGFKDISEQMGHSNITTTIDRYAHLERSDSRDRCAGRWRHAALTQQHAQATSCRCGALRRSRQS